MSVGSGSIGAPLKRARQLEHLALLSISLQSKVDKPWMNTLKIVA